MDVTEPYPALEIVAHNHPMLLSGGLAAISVRYEDGSEALFISDQIAHRADILDHEATHLRTWRNHGPGVPEHGTEFRRTCRKYALSLKACEDKR